MFNIYDVDSEENRKTRLEYEKLAKFNGLRVFDTRFIEGNNIDLCTEWFQLGADILGNSGNTLGYSVSLSGDSKIIAVGSPFPFITNPYTQVYEWTGNVWNPIGDIITSGHNNDDSFGNSVSLSCDGKRVAIGAPRYDENKGLTQVYERDGNSWTKVGGDILGENDGDSSGTSVSLSGDGKRMAVGAPGYDSNKGLTRVYEWSGNVWILIGDILGENDGDLSGTSVSMSDDGNMVVVGTPGYNNGTTSNIGLTRVYERDGNVWNPIGGDILGENDGDSSGFSVSLSGDGKRVAVGAPRYDSNKGLTRVYEWSGNVWNLIGGDILGDGSSGISVSLGDDGKRVGTGAYKFESKGLVRVYEC